MFKAFCGQERRTQTETHQKNNRGHVLQEAPSADTEPDTLALQVPHDLSSNTASLSAWELSTQKKSIVAEMDKLGERRKNHPPFRKAKRVEANARIQNHLL